MLVTLKEILKDAEQKQVAIGSFNTPNLESIMAVIGAAEELDVPVILMHAPGCDWAGDAGKSGEGAGSGMRASGPR